MVQASQSESNGSDPKARLCANCGSELKGPYCWYCGQPTRSFIKFFPALVREVAADTLNYDSRMWRTLKPLMFSPGLLSREYVFGRRARYTSPFRLYIIISLLTFLMVGFLLGSVDFSSGMGTGTEVREVQRSQPIEDRDDPINVFGQEWDREESPVTVGFLGTRGNAWLNDQIERLVVNSRRIQDDPGLFIHAIAGMLPQMMFIMLPLFAVVVTVFYLFSGRYYVEHLVFLVHNHAFIFMVMLLSWALSLITGSLQAAQFPLSDWIAQVPRWTNIILWWWIPVYLLIAMKRFYRQGWILTVIKYFILAWAYTMLFMVATAVVAVLGILGL